MVTKCTKTVKGIFFTYGQFYIICNLLVYIYFQLLARIWLQKGRHPNHMHLEGVNHLMLMMAKPQTDFLVVNVHSHSKWKGHGGG